MKEVAIIQYTVPHFRVGFFEKLRVLLEAEDVCLRLIYSNPDFTETQGRLANQLYTDLPWAEKVPSRRLPGKLLWQPVMGRLKNCDLLIVHHANSEILNWGCYLLPFWRRPKLAFWGHGWNHQSSNPDGWAEGFRAWHGRRASWYFAYTWHVRQELIARGYDPHRITDVQNAIDGPSSTARPRDVDDLRKELGLDQSAWVALYCGRLYRMKQIDMLIDAAKRIHDRLPSFALVVAGAGAQQSIAEKAASEHSFIHFVGPILGVRKATFFALSRICIMPGLVGLGVVDAFHHGVPPVATNFPNHSPEFVYLRDGENGLIADNSAEGLSDAIVRLATGDDLYRRLLEGVETASRTYTVEAMACRFAEGVLAALRAEPKGLDVYRMETGASPSTRAK